ncbi:MAG: diaminopimelate epimerase [Vulcanimicrobiota bacterium]
MKLLFNKMHGLGNDFIFIENLEDGQIDFSDLARNICRRRFSIGADGIVILENSNKADFKMRIFNPDGSEAEMCGNAIRCFARYVYENNLTEKTDLNIETGAGIIKPSVVQPINPDKFLVRVNMGIPILRSAQIPIACEEKEHVIDEIIRLDENTSVKFTGVSMGNPHCVVFLDKVTDYHVLELGPRIEVHPLFPRKTNVEFVQVLDPDHIEVRVWERGAGETLACGTGACATVVAGIIKNMLREKVKVSLPGGELYIQWDDSDSVFMTGPAANVFKGEIEI